MGEIYVIAEDPTVISFTLMKYGLEAGRMAKMYQFGRKTVGPEACAMLQAIKRDKPALLWIQWNPTMVEPTRRGQYEPQLSSCQD